MFFLKIAFCPQNHPADTAKKSETSTKLRFKFSRSHFSLLMKQEIINTGYIHKAIALLLNPIALPEDRIFLTLTLPSLKKLFYPTFLLYARITNSLIGALVYTT